jgi:hypothetical protein
MTYLYNKGNSGVQEDVVNSYSSGLWATCMENIKLKTSLLVYDYLYDAVSLTILHQILGRLVNGDLERILKDAVVTHLRHYPRICLQKLKKPMKNHRTVTQCPGQDSNHLLSTCQKFYHLSHFSQCK